MRPADSSKRYRAVLLDLFGTLVFSRAEPLVREKEPSRARRFLVEALAAELPGISYEAFLGALRSASEEIEEEKVYSLREVSSIERFGRALALLGHDDRSKARRLAEAHMAGLLEVVELPAEHREVVRLLSRRGRVGLVSNFDHGPTARRILEEGGVAGFLEPVVVSDEVGWRKPSPTIFEAALRSLGLRPDEVLFVGDSPLEDIHGARQMGMDAVWLDSTGRLYPGDLLPPTYVFRSLPEAFEELGDRVF
ncbi:MAG: hypothetical protein KatS3mg076_0135 [Candidatus Binatia bacterium]|nr:MAG: hypothetical protein KatS3mg076_0135 [Candidatus Binatia bacterium]